jgi:nitronate monooxygenase
LKNARDDQTAITNIFTGRAARAMGNRIVGELGPMADGAPVFPTAGPALAPLRAMAEAADRTISHPFGPARLCVSVENCPRDN